MKQKAQRQLNGKGSGMVVGGGPARTVGLPICPFLSSHCERPLILDEFSSSRSRREPGGLTHPGHASVSTLDITCSIAEPKGSVLSLSSPRRECPAILCDPF